MEIGVGVSDIVQLSGAGWAPCQVSAQCPHRRRNVDTDTL